MCRFVGLSARKRFCSVRKSYDGGFTLIELLVVVLIIGILAAIALPQYEKAVLKSRAAEAMTVMGSMRGPIDAWLLANGYPAGGDCAYFFGDDEGDCSSAVLDVQAPNFRNPWWDYEGSCHSDYCSVFARFNSEEGGLYMRKTPSAGWKYSCSFTDASGKTAKLCSVLKGEGWTVSDDSEDVSDPE